ncbi:MAG: type II secretion system protein, partial [Candidatus Roizmanbacteria bacterium]
MKKNKGFTLIEILVMLTIVSVLSVTSLVAYSKFTEESSMKQEVLHIVDTIELAKSNARGKRLASDCITILSYDFIVSSNNKYSTALRCNSASGIHEVPFEEITIKPIYSLSYNSSNQLRVYFPID